MNNIEQYFAGEKLQCSIGVIVAIISIAISVYFLTLQKPLLSGISYSFLPIATLLLVICIGIIYRTPADIQRVNSFHTTQPQKMQSDELPRMQKVMSNFQVIKKVEIVFFCVGLLLAFIFWKNGLVKGIGIGLMIQSSILFVFDYFAEARGSIYFEFLKSL